MHKRFLRLMQAFAKRKYLSKKVRLEFRNDGGRARILCDEPVVIARFASHVRQAAIREWGKKTTVLARGQTSNHPGMRPGLFRPPSTGLPTKKLLRAEAGFYRLLEERLGLKRLGRDHPGALLQHYGYSTSWLDLVDNLWVAFWFAAYSLEEAGAGSRKALFREGERGWVYFLSPQAGPRGATCVDIREVHHGLSLRPHAQHGWSLRGPTGSVENLNEYVIATVEVPITSRLCSPGYLGSAEFLFPPRSLDDTLAKLSDFSVDELAREAETDEGLGPAPLGTLTEVSSV